MFDITTLYSSAQPAPAVRWQGFPRYNFVGGNNAPEAIPVETLSQCMQRCLEREGTKLATYHLDTGPQGYGPLREFVAGKLASRGIDCDADDVLLTTGSMQGLDLVNELLLEPGDAVLVEEHCYAGALAGIARKGAEAIGVELDEYGMRMDSLEDRLRALQRQGRTAKYIYTIPTVQNPTSSILPLDRRETMLKLASDHATAVLEDECYADLVWGAERPPAIRALDREARVIHIGSFSKTIAPALRVGYLQAHWQVMSAILANKHDAGSGALEQMLLAEFCPTHFDQHVAALNARLAHKSQALCEALAACFGTTASFSIPVGGIYLWVEFAEPVDGLRLTELALAEGIAVNPGPGWSTNPQKSARSIRVCFANADEQTLRDGMLKLAEVCRTAFGVPAFIANT